MSFRKHLLAVALLLVVTGGCRRSPTAESVIRPLYTRAVGLLSFEIAYMEGAEPDVTDEKSAPMFDLFRRNMTTLFKDAGKEIYVPTTPAELEVVPSGSGLYTKEEALALASKYRQQPFRRKDEMTMYVLFADGFLSENGSKNANVAGLNYETAGVIVIFKGAIDALTEGFRDRRGLLEQTVLLHETGHAIGLVENGLREVSSHLDPEHPNHCTNPKCIMHYRMDAARPIMDFLSRVQTDPNPTLFGDECVEDVRAGLSGAKVSTASSPAEQSL